MKKAIASALLLAAVGFSPSGCVVHEVAEPAPRCRGAVWIPGGYGPRGRWHPAHWRCGRRVIVVE